jgi:hypothetical protein
MKRALGLLLCAAALGTVAADARADAPDAAAVEEGRARFTRGIGLYRDGDYKAALIEFKRAYEVAPAPRLLYDIGQTDFQMQDYAGALSAFQRYLADSGTQVPADRRKQVTEDIAKLRARVGELAVTTNEPGAEISIDDVVVGTTPLAPINVSAGARRVVATLKGHTPASKIIEIAGGDHAALQLALEEVASAAAPAAAPIVIMPVASPSKPPPSSTTPVWIGVGVTSALTVSAVVLGVLSVRANDTYRADLGQFPGNAFTIASARDKVHTLTLATDVTAGAAIVALGITIAVTFVRRSHDNRRADIPWVVRF